MRDTHALVDGMRIIRTVKIPADVFAGWVSSGNPKARCYLPIIESPAPTIDPDTQALVEHLSVSVAGTSVSRTWSVRQKTSEELRKVWTALEFLERFTSSELSTIESQARTDETLAAIYRSCLAAQEVMSDDPRTVGGMGYLVAIGILTQARRDEILSGTASAL